MYPAEQIEKKEREQLKAIYSMVSFTYDSIYECYDGCECVGLKVEENGKFGFLCDKGNMFDLRYLACDYDAVIPYRCHSSRFPSGQLDGYYLFFKVKKDGKWGIASTRIFEKEVGHMGAIHVLCKYDDIIIIPDFRAVAIAKKEGKYCFLKLKTGREGKELYADIFEVVDGSKKCTAGLYFACISNWERSGSSPIIDITTNTVVDYDSFSSSLYKDGRRWKKK